MGPFAVLVLNTALYILFLSLDPAVVLTNHTMMPLDISKKGSTSSETEASEERSLYTPPSSSSDQEARYIVYKPLPKSGYTPSGERLIVESRVLEKSASCKYWADNTEGISEDLALRVTKVACMLVTQMFNSTAGKIINVYGQVGLIKRGRETILVTALHNLVSEGGHGSDRLVALTAFLRKSSGRDSPVVFDALSSRTWKSDLKPLDLRDGATWSYGHDMAWGRFSKIDQALPSPQLLEMETVSWKKEQYVSSAFYRHCIGVRLLV